MRPLHILLAAAVGALLTASAAPRRQSTMAKSLKPSEATAAAAAGRDTVATPGAEVIAIDGYQKVLRAYRESMFVTNNTADTLVGLRLDLRYTAAADGRQLHRRQKLVECTVPPGERRNITFGSWDSQRQFYYIRSPRPKRAKGEPYDVEIRVEAAFFKR